MESNSENHDKETTPLLTPKQREAAANKARYEARKAAGLCVSCGKKRGFRLASRFPPTGTRCGECAENARRQQRTPEARRKRYQWVATVKTHHYAVKKKQYTERKARGKCPLCGKSRDPEAIAANRTLCGYCTLRLCVARRSRRGEIGTFVNGRRVPFYLPHEQIGIVASLTVKCDCTSEYAYKRLWEKAWEKRRAAAAQENRNRRDRGLPPLNLFTEALPVPSKSALLRDLIRRFRDKPCYPRPNTGKRILLWTVTVDIGLDAECLRIIERDAALYTNGNKSEVVRCMLVACYPLSSRTATASGPYRESYVLNRMWQRENQI